MALQARRGDNAHLGGKHGLVQMQVSQSCNRMVPCLWEAYYLCDTWSKLNVYPPKIMQVSSKKCYIIQLYTMIHILARTGLGLVLSPGSTT